MSFYDKEPKILNKKPSKLLEYFGRGMTAFLVIVAGVVFYFALLRFDAIAGAFNKLMDILAPVIYGLVIAFLLNPILKRVEKWCKAGLGKCVKNEKVVNKVSRIIGVFAALIFGVAIIVALFNMLIPELYSSIRDLVLTLPEQIENWAGQINTLMHEDTTVGRFLKDVLLTESASIGKWLQSLNVLEQTDVIISGVTTGVVSVVGGLTDFVIGIIVSVYVLFSKEKFMCQNKKLLYAVTTTRRANLTLHICKKAHDIFNGFIIGKIIDSAIIGVLCFIGVSILKMPYALLVSVIVGVTNVIPVFGPYIGAIPTAILILLVDPMKGLYFIIFVFLLQQLDGNVIGPKILGDSIGVSAFWVLFSILVGGGLFGLVGMIIGVPTFALIYYIVKLIINQKLEDKNLPTDTNCYNQGNYVDENGVFVEVSDTAEKEEKIEEEEQDNADSRTE